MPHTSPTYSLSLSLHSLLLPRLLSFSPLVTRQCCLENSQNPSKRVEIDVKCIELNWFTIQLSIIMLADLYRWPSQTKQAGKHSLESGTKRNRLTYRLAALLCHKTFDEIIINKVLVQKLTGVFKLWQESWWIFIVKWLQSNLSLCAINRY